MTRTRLRLLMIFVPVCTAALTLCALELTFRLVQPARPVRTVPQVRYENVERDQNDADRVDYWRLVPNQKAYHFNVQVETNSLGIRDQEISLVKPSGSYRILAVGDSHTFGYAVDEADTWPRLLEGNLRARSGLGAVEVINGGIEGLSLDQEIQFFKDTLLKIEPDMVVLGYYWNDMPITGDPSTPPRSEAFSAGRGSYDGGEVSTQAQPFINIAPILDLLRESYFVYWVVQRLPFLQIALGNENLTLWKSAILQGQSTARIEASWSAVEGKLGELEALSVTKGFQLIILVIPLFEQMTTDWYTTDGYQARLLGIADKLSIPIIDPLPAIRSTEPRYPDFFIPFDGHPNGRIYETIARHLSSTLPIPEFQGE